MLRLQLSSVLKKRPLRARCASSLAFLSGSAWLGVADGNGVPGLVRGVPGVNCSKVPARLSKAATSGWVPEGGGTSDLAGVGTGICAWAGFGAGKDSGAGSACCVGGVWFVGCLVVGCLVVAFWGFAPGFVAAFLTVLSFFLAATCFLAVLRFPLCCFFPCFPGLFDDFFPFVFSGASFPKSGSETALVKGGGAEVKVPDFRIKCSGVLSC